jgi:hypothetical protein
VKEIASAHTTGLAMTVIARRQPAAAGWKSQNDNQGIVSFASLRISAFINVP